MKIEAYFNNLKAANHAVFRLKNAGFQNAYVDINESVNPAPDPQINQAGTEGAASLSGLVLESDESATNQGKAPLLAASPMVSGVGNLDEVADIRCKVVVETDQGDGNAAKQILKDTGGELDIPSFREPQIIDHEDIALNRALDQIRKNIR